MRLEVETTLGTYSIAVSEQDNPLPEIERWIVESDTLGIMRPVRIVCDRPARHWLDVWALRREWPDPMRFLSADTDDNLTAYYCGSNLLMVPVEIED